MSRTTPPRAAFTVTVTAQDYRTAARIASLNSGRLREAWMGFVLCAALCLTVAGALVAYPIAALLLLLVGGCIALVTLCVMHHIFTRTAAANYHVFATLFPTVRVTLWEDTLDYVGSSCARQEPYALFSRLVENGSSFILLREDGTFLVIPKKDLPPDDAAAAFLRETFARKYRKVR